MLLQDKVAIIYGGSGALGGTTARVFAREGARLHVVGRRSEPLSVLVDEIRAAGGTANFACVDALNARDVDEHVENVVSMEGRIDVALNVVGIPHVQGVPLSELSLSDFLHPIAAYAQANFVTAAAVAKRMAPRGRGVILTVSAPGSQLPGVGYLGNAAACGAVEAFSRVLAGEVGRSGIRVVCLRPNAMPDSLPTSHLDAVFGSAAALVGMDAAQWLDALASQNTLLGRLPTLMQFAEYAAMVASDRAAAMTSAIANLTCGTLSD